MATVISVRFRSGSKTYYFDPRELTVHPGDDVVVETAQGAEFAQCVEGNHDVADEAVVKPLRPVLRWSAALTAARSCSSSPPTAAWTSVSW